MIEERSPAVPSGFSFPISRVSVRDGDVGMILSHALLVERVRAEDDFG